MNIFEVTETIQQGDIEPVSSENETVQQDTGTEQGANFEEVPAERKDTEVLSPVDTPETVPVQEATIAPKPKNKGWQKPKRGRKPKPENADRVQVSVYLSRDVYEGLKALAQAKGLNLSDIVARVMNNFIERNTQSIAKAQQVFRILSTLNVEI